MPGGTVKVGNVLMSNPEQLEAREATKNLHRNTISITAQIGKCY